MRTGRLGMAEIRESVLQYVIASKCLLESEALSEEERDTVLQYVEGIKERIEATKRSDG